MPDTNPYPSFEKVQEIMLSIDEVNKRLAEGWMLIEIRKRRIRTGEEEFHDEVYFVLGLPANLK